MLCLSVNQSMVSGTPGLCGTIAVRFAEAEISLDIVLVTAPSTADLIVPE